jgi:hypothetical protein
LVGRLDLNADVQEKLGDVVLITDLIVDISLFFSILYHLIQFVRLVTCDQNLRNSEFVLCLRERDRIFFS